MNFDKYSELEGKHALLSPSKHYWLNYDEEKMRAYYKSVFAAEKGTEYHEHAAWLIENRIKLKKTKQTYNMYVNDCIGFNMTPEVCLYYNQYCFGHADAISFDEKKNLLRIFDLKTGTTPARMEQLMIYAAIFSLQYADEIPDVYGMDIELRIYQSNEILEHHPTGTEVVEVAKRIMEASKLIKEIATEV